MLWEIRDPENPNLDTLFSFSSQVIVVHVRFKLRIIGLKSGPDQKSNVRFISDPRNRYFDILFDTFLIEDLKLVV